MQWVLLITACEAVGIEEGLNRDCIGQNVACALLALQVCNCS